MTQGHQQIEACLLAEADARTFDDTHRRTALEWPLSTDLTATATIGKKPTGRKPEARNGRSARPQYMSNMNEFDWRHGFLCGIGRAR
jgi:hypothetical protein